MLPDSVRRDVNRRKKIPHTVSLGFEEFKELPSSRELGQWLVEQELDPTQGFGVKRISRSQPVHRFFLQLDSDEMVDKFIGAVGQEGKEWKEKSGQVFRILAKKEGEDWIDVQITNIDPDTPREQVEGYFSHVGEVKDFKQDDLNGMVMDSATIKVKLKEEVEMPTYLVVKGVPGNREGVVVWELSYPDKPMVCYRCYQRGHRRRDCRNPSVPITALLTRPNLAEGGVKGSYAQVVKSREADEAEEEKKVERERQKAVEEEEKKRKIQVEEEERERRRREIMEAEEEKQRGKDEMAKLWKLKKDVEKQKKDYEEEEKSLRSNQNKLNKQMEEVKMRRERLQQWRKEVDEEERLLEEDGRKRRRSGGEGVVRARSGDHRSRSGDNRGNRSQIPHPNDGYHN